MATVVVKYNGRFLDEIEVDAESYDEAIEEAKEHIKEMIDLRVSVKLIYDGEELEEPTYSFDEDELLDNIIESNFEFEVEDGNIEEEEEF